MFWLGLASIIVLGIAIVGTIRTYRETESGGKAAFVFFIETGTKINYKIAVSGAYGFFAHVMVNGKHIKRQIAFCANIAQNIQNHHRICSAGYACADTFNSFCCKKLHKRGFYIFNFGVYGRNICVFCRTGRNCILLKGHNCAEKKRIF